MFREFTMSTLAVLMLASTASAAVTAKETMTPEKLREKRMEKLDNAANKNPERAKALNLQTRVFAGASRIVAEANKSGDPEAIRLAQSLETVVREKDSNGLADTTKPEKTIGDILALMKEGKTVTVALREGLEKNGVKKDKLVECAGK
jgi:alpha-galactosidase